MGQFHHLFGAGKNDLMLTHEGTAPDGMKTPLPGLPGFIGFTASVNILIPLGFFFV